MTPLDLFFLLAACHPNVRHYSALTHLAPSDCRFLLALNWQPVPAIHWLLFGRRFYLYCEFPSLPNQDVPGVNSNFRHKWHSYYW
jgi:hypothetical protein